MTPEPYETADVIIVGSGPAGATTGFLLAEEGVDVLLIDRAIFPRDKSCGDALGYHAVQMMEKLGLGEWLRSGNYNPHRRFLLSSPDGSRASIPVPPDLQGYGYNVPRLNLDSKLVETAVAAGASLHEGVRITAMEYLEGDCVRLAGEHSASGKLVKYKSRMVIAADGGKASFTRQLGLAQQRPDWVAVRAYYEGDTGDRGQLEIHWEQSVLPGYGWIFPSDGGRANVGIGAYTRDVRKYNLNLKKLLETFIEHNPHAQARLGEAQRVTAIVGHPLRADAPDVRPFLDHVLVVGEAAGLVHPLSGEGIGPSMISAELGARFALRALERGEFNASALAAYGEAFHTRFDRLHRLARLARAGINRPWILNRTIQRAGHDDVYAELFYRIMVGQESPHTLFTPAMLLKLLLG